MAADVAIPALSAKNKAIFSSVFSQKSPTRPPQSRHQGGPNTTTRIQDIQSLIQKQIEEDSRRALGVGVDRYALPATEHRHAFKTHVTLCPRMTIVEKPSTENRLTFIEHVLELPSFPQLSIWKSRVGADIIRKIFANVIDKLIAEFVKWSYGGTYTDDLQSHAKFWAEHVLVEYIKVFLHAVSSEKYEAKSVPKASVPEIERYQNMVTSRLWLLRVDELFDNVVDFAETACGVDDLKPLLTTLQARQYLTDQFSKALQARILHPGASTIEILQIYVSVIRVFRILDPKGVLLSKVSGRVRQYLRERDDTVKVVVAGLLADVPPESSERTSDQTSDGVLSELAWELHHRDPNAMKNSSSLDWNNMNWQPDPIDAAPDHMKSNKHTDVIGCIISLFESKEVFVKELQMALAERLLRIKNDYDQEISVLEHLKIKFGDTALQACEVMLKDILDSRRLDQTIRRDQGLGEAGATHGKDEPELHAKILSRLFWPSLPGSTPAYGEEQRQFKPPLHILHQRNLYEHGFENLKQTRKLSWNDNVGQVEVELTFADGRTYHDKVLPYQAGVLYAFNDDNDDDASSTNAPITKSIADLSEELGLSPSLTRSACLLFVSKRVLTPHPTQPDTFTVLEHLSPPANSGAALGTATNQATAPFTSTLESSSAAAAAQQAQSSRAAELAAQQAMKEAEAKEKRAKMAVYQQFITAMLTNQGAMPLPRIAMMLGMVVPGGWPFSKEELRDFLGQMVRDGVIEIAGSNYKKV